MTPLVVPAPLAPGAHVRVVAPSGPVDPARLERGRAALAALGLETSLGEHVLPRSARQDPGRLPYLAAPDAARAADLEQAWLDPGVDGVWAAKGGYGASRVVPLIDWTALRAARAVKPLVGSSDVTALLAAFAARLGVGTFFGPTVAGPVLGASAPDAESLAALRAALLPGDRRVVLAGGTALPATNGIDRAAEGITVGGTLSMVCSLLGTPDAGRARGAIVVLEDVTETPYRIDRLLTQLRVSGWLDGAAGVACGSWTDCGPPDQVEAVLRDRLGDLGVPVVVGLPFGHGPVQATVPLGAPAVLDPRTGTLAVRL
jgi:muramoyltetrapeptide carboxypeptidase